MAVFAVTYDLNVPGQKYRDLIAYLQSLDSFHAQKSMWFVNVATTPIQLRDALMKYFDGNDKVFVSVVIKNTWASAGMPMAAAWLHSRGV